ncbi:MAG: ATP-binding protein [Parcubacteria group bacterium]|nr:ATP-binding protein [Parcubacteria group bacterium]
MPNETRVNLKHLLEDIRDAYASSLEEVIVTELIANALDSKASSIHFSVDADSKVLRCADDGQGMKRSVLREYHNIASTAKRRGAGIGFAGVGAKLSLLLAERVVTESKGGYGSRCATEWRLSNAYRAPWKFVSFSGAVSGPRGTSVSMHFSDSQSHLLKPDFVRRTVIRHFYPLLNQTMHAEFLRYFYKKPIYFFINGKKIELPESGQDALQHWFKVSVGKTRRPAGIGFLAKTDMQGNWLENFLGKKIIATSLPAGLYVSTFGKIIKGGWEWLGIIPSHADSLSGVVEIPGLSEILTTNKNDFLTDSGSLKKYYKFRKAVQEAVVLILERLGERAPSASASPEQLVRPLRRVISGALDGLLGDFPELEGLIGAGRAKTLGRKEKPQAASKKAVLGEEEQSGASEEKAGGRHGASGQDAGKSRPPFGVADAAKKREIRARTSGLAIELADMVDAPDMALGRIIDDVLTVNTLHPAWAKAKQRGMEEYHIVISVALVLSQFLEDRDGSQEFLNRFLAAWAHAEAGGSAKAGTLF